MKIYHDQGRQEDLHQTGARHHPWSVGSYDENVRYYDFVRRPSLVREVLEDFLPYDEYPAIQTFYDLLYWLNGRDSILETNDSGFDFGDSKTTWMPDKKEAEGRWMVFLRDKRLNLDARIVNDLGQTLWNQIEAIDPEFELGYIGFAYCPTIFSELEPPLNRVSTSILTIYFWAWGDTDEEAFENLDRLFANLFAAFRATNELGKTHLRSVTS